MVEKLMGPKDVLNFTARDFKQFGDYVYGYYAYEDTHPFYVGKGRGARALSHWKAAIKGSDRHSHFDNIREILERGRTPIVKLLAYNLERTKRSEVYAVVERTLQNTFGIQKVWDANIGKSRLQEPRSASLLQTRNDAHHYPVLSLEAAFCKAVSKALSCLDGTR